jgi:hypothetical protein
MFQRDTYFHASVLVTSSTNIGSPTVIVLDLRGLINLFSVDGHEELVFFPTVNDIETETNSQNCMSCQIFEFGYGRTIFSESTDCFFIDTLELR